MNPFSLFQSSARRKQIIASPTFRRRVIFALVLGLLLRLGGGFLMGSQDMEWWKVWAKDFHDNGLIGCYGPPDAEIVERLSAGQSLQRIYKETGRIVHSTDYVVGATRVDFPVVQPPIFHYLLWVVSKAYSVISPTLENTRVFNFFINIPMLLASILLAWLFFRGLVSLGQDPQEARLSAVGFWLFPLMILNSPIQGYFDMVLALGCFATFLALAKRNLVAACMLCTLTFLSKPQGVLIVPLVLAIGFLDFRPLQNLKAWAAAAGLGGLVASPYFLSGYGLSFINAVLHPTQHAGSLSVQSLNFWWLLNYRVAFRQLRARKLDFFEALSGNNMIAMRIYTLEDLEHALKMKFGIFPYLIFPVLAIAVIFFAISMYRSEAKSIFFAATMYLYAYVIFALGVHTNHYFLMLPLLLISASLYPEIRRWACAVSLVFLSQDLFFYGFGRDFSSATWYATQYGWSFLTLIPALCSVGFFFWGLKLLIQKWKTLRQVSVQQ